MELLVRRHPKDVAIVELYIITDDNLYLFGTSHIDWFIGEECHKKLFEDESVIFKLEEKK